MPAPINISESFQFFCKPWDELSRDELHALIRLRIDVFVVEQNCPYPDLDGKDLRSHHVYAIKRGDDIASGTSASATIRICAPGVSYDDPSLGRVVTSTTCRGQGLGISIMNLAIAECNKLYPGHGIRISAQCYLEKFYSDLGFVSTGETYLEDDIPHIQMFRAI
ncbi:MAG TPA: GNAT family N-acetyltransferase [Flavobacteriales bacterium]|jgi:ElaA protein|nr:GNAT family N-acetyltransferase [Flavobacteriales bacterium]HIN41702.1 GNAT family N-acetyltransferase [Flavobacteriales bacterium]HIO59255.1 GNAT family N-acetyltransferase [Flavobacteriales bacterium]